MGSEMCIRDSSLFSDRSRQAEALVTEANAFGPPIFLSLPSSMDSALNQVFDRLLRWPPADVHLVLISRHDPPLALARLRLEEKLAEVRFADLAFTRGETAELLSEWGVHLSEAALGRLTESTGGWVAAIRLAALTLKTASDPSDVIERFGGPTFLVSEYLWDEVLHLLPARYSEFLLRTSIAPRICAPLAAALTDEQRVDALCGNAAFSGTPVTVQPL